LALLALRAYIERHYKEREREREREMGLCEIIFSVLHTYIAYQLPRFLGFRVYGFFFGRPALLLINLFVYEFFKDGITIELSLKSCI
jgi:Ni,Fe-hydrogenase I cytochrome b subunit